MNVHTCLDMLLNRSLYVAVYIISKLAKALILM